MKTKEEQFWAWFEEHQEILFEINHEQYEWYDALGQQLMAVNEGLTFEFSSNELHTKKDLFISADGMNKIFPVVIKLVQSAPQLDKWNIKAFRQRIQNQNISIQINDIELCYQDMYFSHQPDFDKIGLKIHVRNFIDNQDYVSGIFIMLDALLGEYDVGTQISFIEWQKLDENHVDQLTPFTQLYKLVQKHKALKN
jgi:hypothetical protein